MESPIQEQYRDFYGADDPIRVGRTEMPAERAVTLQWLARANTPLDGVVLELGCGMGPLSDVHAGYIGLDFSHPALKRFPRERPRVHGDMQRLPYRNASADFVFSWAALEHVPNPALVLDEILRIVRPGGVAMLAPAWHVRSWAAKALPIRAYRDLTLADRVRKASIPLREHLAFRALASLPGRMWREVRALRGPIAFSYGHLEPNLTSYEYTDSDAFTSMDPHAAATFFVSRGWRVLSHDGLRARILARHGPVVVQRPT